MDPITLIVSALAAGAGVGVTDTASSAVKDAYAGLKGLVRNRLAGRPDAGTILARHEDSPETWRAPLMAELAATSASQDADLVAAAQALMDLLDSERARPGKYTVDARGAQGVQVGDHDRQDNVFHAPRGASAGSDSQQPGQTQ